MNFSDLNIDDLRWNDFYKHTKLNINKLPKNIKKYNRLISHTENFFLIAGYGAFNEGYVLLLPKNLISSFSHLETSLLEEFLWFRKIIIKELSNTYKDFNIADFEHGLCACLGGLDRAHLHFMPYKKINKNNIINSINKSLFRRAIGNITIKIDELVLTHPDDIKLILNKKDNKKYKMTGKFYKLNDIVSNHSIYDYPLINNKKIKNSKPYIYFNSGYVESSFITFNDISTQFGREIIFNIDYFDQTKIKALLKKNKLNFSKNKLYWRWQDELFRKNIILTIHKLSKRFNSFTKKYEKYYNFQTYK